MIEAINLTIEHLVNPIGMDVTAPRLFWQVGNAVKQLAYQIVAVNEKNQIVWDSQRVNTSRMFADYQGELLKSRDRIFWRIRLWDDNDHAGNWSQAFFEMGLLESADWKASWITANLSIDKKKRYPSDYFRKEFEINKKVKSARLYITACGLYEGTLNGLKIGNDFFTPGYTDYEKRIQYQTYDITEKVKQGNNIFDVILGDGWYRGCIGALSFRNVFGTETKLLCQIELTFADDTEELILSDESFSWCNDGPIIYSDLKNGEVIDATLKPSFSSKAKKTTCLVTPSASNNVTVKEHEHFKPVLLLTPSGKTVLDFGQNMSGLMSFSVTGKKGHEMTLHMGECLDHGEFTNRNFQCRSKEPITQKIQFTCSGQQDSYQSRFSFFGFRYALVENWPGEINPDDFTAIAIYSDMKETGNFTCSNQLINQLVSNTRWSMKSNFIDVPTDCPTRELAGWTGDAQIFCRTSRYLMDSSSFFMKWMHDLADRQTHSGKVHCIVPRVGNDGYIKAMDGCVGWADASVYVPYHQWKMTGDDKFITNFYDTMRNYAFFMINRAKKTFITNIFKRNQYRKYTYDSYQHFGEWLEPKGVEPGNFIVNIILPKPEEATAYLSLTMSYMAEMSRYLGKKEDEILFSEYAKGAKKAYNHLFVKQDIIDTDRQAKLVRPLAFGLLDGKIKANVENRLEKALTDNSYKIGTGFLSTSFILPVLTSASKLDIAFKVLENEECPGWLYQIKNGATTIWESWEGYDEMGHPFNSHNHYSPGAVTEWLFETVGGISVAGENQFIIQPHYGGTLKNAQTWYDSIYGKVETKWALKDRKFILDVSIPCNITAVIILPNGDQHEVGNGNYHFEMKRDQSL
ncbi:MAG: family 78 glycoside hydrolase catalytic domain [Clostridia bacterium]|nr:family 78 glycoside hydrolase catalytic domain [Clostridia bacterium]